MGDMGGEGLFEEPERSPLSVGDRAQVLTIWGLEPCRVEAIGRDADGWPMVTVTTRSGDRVTVARSSIVG